MMFYSMESDGLSSRFEKYLGPFSSRISCEKRLIRTQILGIWAGSVVDERISNWFPAKSARDRLCLSPHWK